MKTILIIAFITFFSFMGKAQEKESTIQTVDYPASFHELLQPFKGNIVYIDVMASWCKPCLEELPASKSLDNFFEENNVVRLFITIDEPNNFTKCKDFLNQHQLSGFLASYHPQEKIDNNVFAKEFENVFLKDENGSFSLRIPRYAIVDKTGKMVVKNAASPSNPDALKKQLIEINKKEK